MMDDLKARMPSPTFAGRYLIRRELGRGMMGIVYEAEDRVLGRIVAIKTIELAFNVPATDREEFEHRFFTEARVAAKLSHPGIVVCHDVGKAPETGELFIVFEHLKGRTLADRIAEGPMAWPEALSIAARIGRAIHHAHEYGVVHRDLKPANVMLLDPRDRAAAAAGAREEPAIKIMDFGVAKVMETARHRLTAGGRSFGSPLYMAPEQVLGGPSDARGDIFSLGSVLCTLLLGRPWFYAPNVPQILQRVVHEEAPVLSALRSDLPPALDAIVARALAKPPERRYPSAAALADDLEDVAAGHSPRHVTGWSAPPPADIDHLLADLTAPAGVDPAGVRTGTLDIGALVEEPPLDPAPVPASPPARARRAWMFVAAVPVVAVLAAGVVWWLRREPMAIPSNTAPVPAAVEARLEAPVPIPSAVPSPDVATAAAAEIAAPTVAPAEETPTAPPPAPAPITRLRAETSRARTASSVPAEAAPRTRLRLDVEHPLESGRLIVWLDGALVVEEKLHAPVSKTIIGIKKREDRLEKMFDVAPGQHEVRIEVRWGDSRRAGTRVVDVTEGATGLLEARLVGMAKTLNLEWSPLTRDEATGNP